MNSKETLYAVDCSLVSTKKLEKDAKSNNLESVKTWMIENKLTLNQAAKINLGFGSKSIQMINPIVDTSWLFLDEKLSFKFHIPKCVYYIPNTYSKATSNDLPKLIFNQYISMLY